VKKVPFKIHIKIPMPLRAGIEYGFKPGSNISRKGSK